jgi:hypothetical protein
MISSWDEFKALIGAHFKPINSVKAARDKLANHRQTRSVQEYTYRFRQIILEIPSMSEDEKLDRFTRGLKPQTRNEVELREPSSLDELVRIAERFDSISFQTNQREPERRYVPRPAFVRNDPMEIDNIQYKKLSDHEKETLRKNGDCFYCRKHGHRAIDCPEKKDKTGPKKQRSQ